MAGTTIAGASLLLPAPSVVVSKSPPRATWLNQPWARSGRAVHVARAGPGKISEKVEESIKQAEEACSGDPASGECVAAWDEVEELSAAASHARDKAKETDVLEEYCKDNPETDECRTYED